MTGAVGGLTDASCASRALSTALEPVIGSVYFAPEAHAAYAALGFGASPGPISGDDWAEAHWGKVAMPDGLAYFASRGGLLGQVRGTVVAAAFGVFNPAAVAPAVDAAWQVASADAMVAARASGAVGQLTRVLGDAPAVSTGPSSCWAVPPRRSRQPVARCTPVSSPRRCPPVGSARCGTSATSCASSAATPTWPRSALAASTAASSRCSPSAAPGCRRAPTRPARAWDAGPTRRGRATPRRPAACSMAMW